MSVPRLVLHVGMQQTGARMIQRALTRLRPQLRHHGVGFLSERDVTSLDHTAGCLNDIDASLDDAPTFERELHELVVAQMERVREPRVALISSDRLLGAANLGRSDEKRFRPFAEASIEQVVMALEPEAVEIVLIVRRQDRLMEACYLRAIQAGEHHPFPRQFRRRFEPRLDYVELLERLERLDGVRNVRVRPFELIGAGPRAFVDDFLAAVDLGGKLDLSVLPATLEPYRMYSRRGMKIARRMNRLLDTDRERAAVCRFLLEQYGSSDDRETRFLPKRARQRIIESYRDTNEALFARYMPDLPVDAYSTNEATRALGTILDPAPGRRSIRWATRKVAGSAYRRIKRLAPAR